MKKTFSKLEENFDNVIWSRGKEYYREGLIGNIIREGKIKPPLRYSYCHKSYSANVYPIYHTSQPIAHPNPQFNPIS